MVASRLSAVYHVRSTADAIDARAQAIAVEQSVEMPLDAITDARVLSEIVGQVEDIADLGDGRFRVRIGLATATTGREAGQLMNMLFGNTSIHDDVELADVMLPPEMARMGGPNVGIWGLRDRVRADGRALSSSALKPQGLPAEGLAELAYRLARAGIDLIKDDHGLANQSYSPFAERVPAVARAVAKANSETGRATRYAPSLSGDLDALRLQIRLAREEGLDTVLVAPLVIGLPSFHNLVRTFSDMAFLAHPAMAGAARIAPDLLIGKLFRLLGADAVVFPNHGGRFGYSPETCLALAQKAKADFIGLKPSLPVPAGGMSLDRVAEMLEFYGPDVMLLIGGNLLAAGDRLTEEAAAFHRRIHDHGRY